MVGVPQKIPQILSNVLANYNFVDIAAGTGFINFYAGKTVDLNLLSNFTYYSDTITSACTGATTTNYVLVLDEDYDIILNRPLDIKGNGIVNIPIGGSSNSGSYLFYVDVTLRKVTGGVESDIVVNTSRIVTNPSSATYTMLAVDLNVANVTHYKIGDTVRVSIQVYAKLSSGGYTASILVAHDPKSRTTGWDSTGAVPSQLVFQCPVRLNL